MKCILHTPSATPWTPPSGPCCKTSPRRGLQNAARWIRVTWIAWAVAMGGPVPVGAQTLYTWNGNTDQEWRRLGNWTTSQSTYPDSGNAVVTFDGSLVTPSDILSSGAGDPGVDLLAVQRMQFAFSPGGGTWRILKGVEPFSTIVVVSDILQSGGNAGTVEIGAEISFTGLMSIDMGDSTFVFQDRLEGFSFPATPFIPPALNLGGNPGSRLVLNGITEFPGTVFWNGGDLEINHVEAVSGAVFDVGTGLHATVQAIPGTQIAAVIDGAGSILTLNDELEIGRFIGGAPDIFGGSWSGSGTLRKIKNGKVRWSGPHSNFTGVVDVEAGELQLVVPDALKNALLQMDGGNLSMDHFDFQQGDLTFGDLAGSGDIPLGTNSLATGSRGGNVVYTGSLSGAADVTKQGAGMWDLLGNQAITGTVHILNGMVRAGSTDLRTPDIHLGPNGTLRTLYPTVATDLGRVYGEGTLDMDGVRFTMDMDTDAVFSGAIMGNTGVTGPVSKRGTSILTLSGTSNNFSGGLEVVGGGIIATGDGSLGAPTGNLAVGFGSFIRMTEDAISTRPWISSGAPSTYMVDSNKTWTLSGNFSDLSVSHTHFGGGGTFVLTAAQTSAGTFTLDAGELQLMNASGSALGGGDLTLSPGSVLSGTGAHAGAVLGLSGSTVSPGTSIGTLSLGELDLDGTLEIELLPTASDRLDVSGLLDIADATLRMEASGNISTGAYVIATYDTLNGPFDSIDVPFNYELLYGQGPGGNEIHFIPRTNDPYVVSMTASESGSSSATQIVYTIVFSEAVQPITVDDLFIDFTGFSVGAPLITGSDFTWQVTLNVAGTGTLSFDISDAHAIKDLEGNSLVKRTSPILISVSQYQRIYVSQNGAHTPPFTSWATAATNLVAALDLAVSNEIWVAEGIWTPGSQRTNTFEIKSGVVMYGGFAGDEVALLLRNSNPLYNGTVLSGDIGVPGDDADNVHHVVTLSGLGSTAVLDGFTIRDGNAAGGAVNGGGGILSVNSSGVRLANCAILQNQGAAGGGVHLAQASTRFENCYISLNAGSMGGGLYMDDSSPVLINCQLDGNTAERSAGAAFMRNYSEPEWINCTIGGNEATDLGGALESAGARPHLGNTVVWSNSVVAASAPADESLVEWSIDATFSHSILQHYSQADLNLDGSGNLEGIATNDPLFIASVDAYPDPAFPGNYRYRPGSPLQDNGENAANNTLFDLDMTPRVQNVNIDLGAYEGSSVYDRPPACTSIMAHATSPMVTNALSFTVLFDEPVFNVSVDDFDVYLAGSLDFSNKVVTGTGSVYQVDLIGLTGVGALYMEADLDGNIVDFFGQLLATSVVSEVLEVDAEASGSIGLAAGDDAWNPYEIDSGFTIGGSSIGLPPGQPVFLTLTDSTGHVVRTWTTVQNDGSWSALFGDSTIYSDKILVDETGSERDPECALLANGDVVVAYWNTGNAGDGPDNEAMAIGIGANGQVLGPATKLDAPDAESDTRTKVAALEDGGWIAVWEAGQTGPNAAFPVIMMQRYDAAGFPVGTNQLASIADDSRDFAPDVCGLSDGGWLVAWITEGGLGTDGADNEIMAQRFDASGVSVTGVFKADDPDGNRTDAAIRVTSMKDGGWLMAWQGWDTSVGTWDVYYNRYSAAGTNLTGDVPVDGGLADATHEVNALVTVTREGGWIISFGRDADFYVRAFSSDGTPGPEQVVNVPETYSTGRALRSLRFGGSIHAFQRGTLPGESDLLQQRFDEDHGKLGGFQTVDQPDPGLFDGRCEIEALYDGGWYVVWEAGGGLAYQRFNVLGEMLPDQVAVTSLLTGPVTLEVSLTADNQGTIALYRNLESLDLTPYQIWLDGFGVTGNDRNADADPNLNGWVNAAEFGLNGDPVTPGVRPVMRARWTPVNGTNRFVYTFPVRNGATFSGPATNQVAGVDGIRYRVDGSIFLPQFDQPVVEVIPAMTNGLPTVDPGWNYKSFHLQPDDPAPDNGYLRLNIEAMEGGP